MSFPGELQIGLVLLGEWITSLESVPRARGYLKATAVSDPEKIWRSDPLWLNS